MQRANRSARRSAVVAVAMLGVCGLSACHTHVGGTGMEFAGQDVHLRAPSHDDATISSDGTLKIGSGVVPLTDAQRAGVVAIYAAAQSIKQHGLETGKAGVAVGAEAASEALHGLANGDTSQIGAKVEAKADEVRRAAARICADVAQLRQAELAVAASLPAFSPYVSVSEGDVAHCEKDTKPG